MIGPRARKLAHGLSRLCGNRQSLPMWAIMSCWDTMRGTVGRVPKAKAEAYAEADAVIDTGFLELEKAPS